MVEHFLSVCRNMVEVSLAASLLAVKNSLRKSHNTIKHFLTTSNKVIVLSSVD